MQKRILTPPHKAELARIWESRFEENRFRHKGIEWSEVAARLESNPGKWWSLGEMERTGGEPDVVDYDNETGQFIFYDCSAESPKGRRNLSFDREGRESRKSGRPDHNAVDMAAGMGIRILNEKEYRNLQNLGAFDTKTSSWIETPDPIRRLGGALFGDRRYDHVFVYHNSAGSYYAARGFRGVLIV